MNCDLCGKEAELHKALIEGSQMNVCGNCIRYGRIVETAQKIRPTVSIQKTNPEEETETLVSNFGEILKRKREQLRLTHREFAAKIAERESTLHKLETGTIALTIAKARKLEKMFGLKLVEEVREEPVTRKVGRSEMTLGDVIRIKTKKKKATANTSDYKP